MISAPKRRLFSDLDLASLAALKAADGVNTWVTAPAVARVGRTGGMELNSPSVYRILSKLREEVEYRTVDGVRRFHLKQQGQVALSDDRSDSPVGFVMPGTPWSTHQQLKKHLAKYAAHNVFIIDPYIAEETLDLLADVQTNIQLLTAHLGRKGKEEAFMRALKMFQREKRELLEVRKASGDRLHGRYLFVDERCWVVDHSLQDIGTKPALILPLRLDGCFSEVRDHFVAIFKGAAIVS